MVSALDAVELRYALKYIECGMFEESEPPVYYGYAGISNLGIAETGDANLERTFLVLRNDDLLKVREVSQRRGGAKFAVDQMANPGTVILRPGGRYLDLAFIAGMVGTVHRDLIADELLRAFLKAFRATFTKVRSYLVGPAAKKHLGTNVRFTANIHWAADLDLKA
ncbi:MAG TPA: hypothetical protein VKT81_12135 [Bryobacteraceae bacterium]|nr:hypothetical protein [Bryobacteraceae bacterium]